MPRRTDHRQDAEAADDRRAALRLMDVSCETEERLARYVDHLRRWQTIKNLVASSTLSQVWTRHIADSAQLVPLMPKACRWVDFGTGAGFPGVVVALLLQGRGSVGARVDLIESNGRKCAFLRDVVRDLGCPAVVHHSRVEAVIDRLEDVEVVTSRALAPLPDLITMSESLLAKGAVGLFLKSVSEVETIDPALWQGRWTVVPSRTSAGGRIVMVAAAQAAHGGSSLGKEPGHD